MRPIHGVALALGVCLLLSAGPASAQDAELTRWLRDPGDPGLWIDPANWTAGGSAALMPEPATLALLAAGAAAGLARRPRR